MKTVLIITSHYPPSNLTSVHRARLFARHLPSFSWLPIILTVDAKYYEEKMDMQLLNLIPVEQRIETVNAFPLTKPRLIGDIGLRAFLALRKKALQLIRTEEIDFIYILIPSFYISLLGPYLKKKTGINYGIDYIDPWVHEFAGSNHVFSRAWFTTKLSRLLEPLAVKKASLITGVATSYFEDVFNRNPTLLKKCLAVSMPYGYEMEDHLAAANMKVESYLFERSPGVLNVMYAGAVLPKAVEILEAIFKNIAENRDQFQNIFFHFVGTGVYKNNRLIPIVRPIAEKYELYSEVVFEKPDRISYMDVLANLHQSDRILILGSTEPHYTPSKVYQALLAKKPIIAVLHENSEAISFLESQRAAVVLKINEISFKSICNSFTKEFKKSINEIEGAEIELTSNMQSYSAYASAQKLSEILNQLIDK